MNEFIGNVIALILWPGVISALVLGWMYLWLFRKLTAQLQGRQGPPFYQPFFDTVKLLGKEDVRPIGGSRLYPFVPWIGLISMVFALAILPVPGNPISAFSGDLIVFIYLMEMPAFCEILAGYSTRSPYAQVSAVREAMMSLGYNLPFLAALIALSMHAHSFRMVDIAAAPLSWTHLAAALAFLLALPARLKANPFSIPNAEQELAAGVHNEYSGPLLAIFEMSYALELVAMVGVFAAFYVGPIIHGTIGLVVYLLVSVLIVVLVTVLSSATARLKLNQAFRFYWSWGAAAAALVLIVTWMER
jgi:NADH-quinone oxidoreductase subunit H